MGTLVQYRFVQAQSSFFTLHISLLLLAPPVTTSINTILLASLYIVPPFVINTKHFSKSHPETKTKPCFKDFKIIPSKE